MQTISQLSEPELQQLVSSAIAGDGESFGRLYDSLYAKVYTYAYKRTLDVHIAEDITANSFYHLMTHIASFKWYDAARFYAWVFRITMNEITTYFRQGTRYVLTENWLDLADIAGDAETQLDTMQKDERYASLQNAMKKLPPKLANVVELYYFANLSHSEIAATLMISESAARVRLHRGIHQLQAKMEGDRL